MNRRRFLAALAALPIVGKLLASRHNCEFHDWRYSHKHYLWICHNCGFGDNDWAQHSRWREPQPYRYEPTTTLPEVKWRDPQGDLEKIVAEIHRGRGI